MLCAQHNSELWTTTTIGGDDLNGSIVKFNTSNGVLTKVYGLPSEHPGKTPQHNQFVDIGNGKLYAALSSGGAYDAGVIVEYDPATNTYVRKANFNSAVDGNIPRSAMAYMGGKFYGTTMLGGTTADGIIYEWDPVTNVITKRFDFVETVTGAGSWGGLVYYGTKFYGVMSYGGANALGTLYEWDPVTNAFTVLHHMTGTATGSAPYGTPVIVGGKIYGTTYYGGTNNNGTIFEYDLSTSTYTKKFDMASATGRYPRNSMVLHGGLLYGTTMQGGNTGSQGVIFEYNPVTNVYTKKVDMFTSTGITPDCELEYGGGKFYGTTYGGGLNNHGVIFEWDPVTNVYAKKKDFATMANPYGYQCNNSLCYYGAQLYGFTQQGGAASGGIVFKLDIAPNVLTKIGDLNSKFAGKTPKGGLTMLSGKLYGMTEKGGVNDMGVIFEIDPATGVYIKKVDFDGTNKGSQPWGSMTVYNNKLYGLTYNGGTNGVGVIFEYDPATNIFTKKIDFNFTTHGGFGLSNLVLFQGKFYAALSDANAAVEGTLIEWDPVTNICTKKQDFNSTNGRWPHGSMVEYQGWLYGLTYQGGTTQDGVMYGFNPVSNLMGVGFHFNSLPRGADPVNALTVVGTKMYGITFNGGTSDHGAIFEWVPATSTFTKKFDLNGASSGAGSMSTMIYYNNLLYGLTYDNGSLSTFGTIFSINPTTSAFTKLHDFNLSEGGNPEGDFLLVSSNNAPVLSNLPGTQSHCSISSSSVTFDYVDADGDVPSFTVNSTNTTLIPNANISVALQSGSTYVLNYTPVPGQTGTTTISVTVNDGYGSVQVFNFNVNINHPVVNLGADISQCGGNVTLNAQNPGCTYAWSTGSSAQSILVTTTGQYFVDVTDVNSCVDQDTIAVAIHSFPMVNLGGDVTQCGGNVTLNAQNPGATYQWNTSATTQTLNISASGLYYVDVTNVNGCTKRDTVVITIHPIPVVNLGGTVNQCGGSVLLNAQNPGSTYLWNDNSTAQTLSVNTSGQYFVTVESPASCSNSDTVQVNIFSLPTVGFIISTVNDTVCANNPAFSLTGGSPAGGIYSGSGVTGGNIFNPSLSGAGNQTITYTFTDGNGCVNSEQEIITVHTQPNVNVSLNANAVCVDNAMFMLTGGSPAGGTYSGMGVTAGNFSAQTAGVGTHTITYSFTDGNGCTNDNTDFITVNNCTSISNPESQISNVEVYPNPFNSGLNISSSCSGVIEIEMFNSLGELILATQIMSNHTLQTANLARGMYLLFVKTAQGITTKKIIKQ